MARSKLCPASNTARYPSRKKLVGAVGAVALLGVLGCGEVVDPVADASAGISPADVGQTRMDAGRPDAGPEHFVTDASGIWPADAE